MTTTTSPESVRQASRLPREGLDESRAMRIAAAGGIAFVVLNVVGSLAPGAAPASDASAAKVAAYFRDHPGAIRAQLLLGAFGIAMLFWWFGGLWRLMSRAEGDRPRLAIVAAVSLASGVTLAAVSGAANATAAIRVDNVDTTHMLYSLSLVTVAAAGFGLGAFLIATGVLAFRSGALPRWTCYVGWLSAIGFLVGGLGTVSDSSTINNTLGLAAFLIWCVWIIGVSAFMWRAGSRAA